MELAAVGALNSEVASKVLCSRSAEVVETEAIESLLESLIESLRTLVCGPLNAAEGRGKEADVPDEDAPAVAALNPGRTEVSRAVTVRPAPRPATRPARA